MERGGCFRILVLVILVLFFISFVLAQDASDTGDEGADEDVDGGEFVGEDNSYIWLREKTAGWDLDPIKSSLAILALINNGDDVTSGVNALIKNKDPTHCWPKGDCKVIDTAFATLALYQAKQDVDGEIAWLQNKDGALNPAMGGGDWLIMIESEGSGTCTVTYGGGKTKDFEVNGPENTVSPSSDLNNYFIVINKDLPGFSVSQSISEEIDVNCGALPAGIIISLMYRVSGNLIILEQHRDAHPVLSVNNACYGIRLTSQNCDYLSTMYASWVLSEMGEGINTRAYLESEVTNKHDLERAVVGRITGRPLHLDYLKNSQDLSTGAWRDGHVYTTAWVIFALWKASGVYYSEIESGSAYLRKVVAADGHWNNDVGDTAMALIALYGRDLQFAVVLGEAECEINDDCDEGYVCEFGVCVEEVVCDYDYVCDWGLGEGCECTDCEDETDCEGPECEINDDCDEGYVCEFGECVAEMGIACNFDDYCDWALGEGCECTDCEDDPDYCFEEDECEDDEDCVDLYGKDYICDFGECIKEEKEFPWGIVIIVIIILLLIGGGFFFYSKFVRSGGFDISSLVRFKRKPKKPPVPPYTIPPTRAVRPITPGVPPARIIRPAKKSKAEEELEKSLKEAEKLLRG